MNAFRTIGICLGLTFLGACGIAEEVKESTPQPSEVASISRDYLLAIVSGEEQSGFVGDALPSALTVRLMLNGAVVPEQTIEFSITLGSGGFSGEHRVPTNENGKAQVSFILPDEPGEIHIQAKALIPDFDETKHQVEFRLFALPLAEKKLFIANHEANSQSQAVDVDGPLPLPLEVIAKDERGNPVSGANIQFSLGEDSAPASFTENVLTDEHGKASTNLDFGTQAGEVFVNAQWMGDAVIPGNDRVEFHAHALPGTPYEFLFEMGAVEVGEPSCRGEGHEFSEFLARLVDAFGNGIEGPTVTVDPNVYLRVRASDADLWSSPGQAITKTALADGVIRFGVKAAEGQIPEDLYRVDGRITLNVSGVSDFTNVEVTKNKWIESLDDTTHYYGGNHTYIVCYDDDGFIGTMCQTREFEVNIQAYRACGAPWINAEIRATAHKRYGSTTQCSENILNWWNSDESSHQTDSDGLVLFPVEALVQYWPGEEIWTQANRITISANEANSLQYFADSHWCLPEE